MRLRLFALAAVPASALLNAFVEPRPDAVIILADAAVWGDYSASGNTQVRTPYIDSPARRKSLVIASWMSGRSI